MGIFSSGACDFTPAGIPSLASKVILVTGGNSGVGRESVLQLSLHSPAKIYLGARSRAKYEAAISEMQKSSRPPDVSCIEFLEIDLASLTSVKAAAERVLAANTRLDVLMNNAGVMALPPGLTSEGYEIQFGTNHVGHALLTKLLIPLLLKTADARIVNVSSAGHQMAPAGGFLPDEAATTMEKHHTYRRYGQSKLANVLFTKELARLYPTVTSVVIHPGRVQTPLLDAWFSAGTSPLTLFMNVIDYFVMVSVEKGAYNQLWAATAETHKDKKADGEKAPQLSVKSGAYYTPVGREGGSTFSLDGGESAMARDPVLAEKLWDWTEAELAKHGY